MDIFQMLPVMGQQDGLNLQGMILFNASIYTILRLQLKIIIVFYSCAKLNIVNKFFLIFLMLVFFTII